MYSIILKNGKTINIKADDIALHEKERIRLIKFYDSATSLIAEINMDNVVGWARTDCIKNEE